MTRTNKSWSKKRVQIFSRLMWNHISMKTHSWRLRWATQTWWLQIDFLKTLREEKTHNQLYKVLPIWW